MSTTWTQETVGDSGTATSTSTPGTTMTKEVVGLNIAGEYLSIDSIKIDGATIGHEDDTDLMALSNGTLSVNGILAATGNITAGGNLTVTGNTINSSIGTAMTMANGGGGKTDISFSNDIKLNTQDSKIIFDTSEDKIIQEHDAGLWVGRTGAASSSINKSLTIATVSGGGTINSGVGVGIDAYVHTSASNPEIIGSLDFVTTDVSSGSEDADFVVNLMASGNTAAEKFRVASNGNVTIPGDLTVSGDFTGMVNYKEFGVLDFGIQATGYHFALTCGSFSESLHGGEINNSNTFGGNGTDPMTSLDLSAADSTTVDRILVRSMWYIEDNIEIDSIRYVYQCDYNGSSPESNSTLNLHVMSYDLSSIGDLSNGVVVADGGDAGTAKRGQVVNGTLSVNSDNKAISSGKVVIVYGESPNTETSVHDVTIKCVVKYHLT